jgi:hypothetical protein
MNGIVYLFLEKKKMKLTTFEIIGLREGNIIMLKIRQYDSKGNIHELTRWIILSQD